MQLNAEKKQFLRLYIASVGLLLALAAVGYFLAERWGLISGPNLSVSSSAPRESKIDMTYVGVPRMTVSLGNGLAMQMRVDIFLEVETKDASVVEGYMPRIMDRLNACLPKVKFEKISDPTAMFLLHKEMLWQINSIGMPVLVHDLMLQNMILM